VSKVTEDAERDAARRDGRPEGERYERGQQRESVNEPGADVGIVECRNDEGEAKRDQEQQERETGKQDQRLQPIVPDVRLEPVAPHRAFGAVVSKSQNFT